GETLTTPTMLVPVTLSVNLSSCFHYLSPLHSLSSSQMVLALLSVQCRRSSSLSTFSTTRHSLPSCSALHRFYFCLRSVYFVVVILWAFFYDLFICFWFGLCICY